MGHRMDFLLKLLEKYGLDGLVVALIMLQARSEYRLKKLEDVKVVTQDACEQYQTEHERRFGDGRREFDNLAGAIKGLHADIQAASIEAQAQARQMMGYILELLNRDKKE